MQAQALHLLPVSCLTLLFVLLFCCLDSVQHSSCYLYPRIHIVVIRLEVCALHSTCRDDKTYVKFKGYRLGIGHL